MSSAWYESRVLQKLEAKFDYWPELPYREYTIQPSMASPFAFLYSHLIDPRMFLLILSMLNSEDETHWLGNFSAQPAEKDSFASESCHFQLHLICPRFLGSSNDFSPTFINSK